MLPTTEIAGSLVGSLGKKVGQSMTNGTIPPSTKSPYKIRSSRSRRSHPIFNGFKKEDFFLTKTRTNVTEFVGQDLLDFLENLRKSNRFVRFVKSHKREEGGECWRKGGKFFYCLFSASFPPASALLVGSFFSHTNNTSSSSL